jgi:hypothetical protein
VPFWEGLSLPDSFSIGVNAGLDLIAKSSTREDIWPLKSPSVKPHLPAGWRDIGHIGKGGRNL